MKRVGTTTPQRSRFLAFFVGVNLFGFLFFFLSHSVSSPSPPSIDQPPHIPRTDDEDLPNPFVTLPPPTTSTSGDEIRHPKDEGEHKLPTEVITPAPPGGDTPAVEDDSSPWPKRLPEGLSAEEEAKLRQLYEQSDKVGVAVLPEMDSRLTVVILNAIDNLPPEWKFQIFHSPHIANEIMALPELQPYQRIGRITFTPTINSSMSYEEYSDLLRSAHFWEQVQGEYILTIQTDAVLCSRSPYSINDFLEYDWVGSPWKRWPHLLAGNGGLSLRRKSKLLETIQKCSYLKKPRVEDMWFAYCFRQLPHMGRNYRVKLALQEVAVNFAVETIYSPTPLGVHKPWNWLSAEEYAKIVEYCPEVLLVAPEGAGQSTSPKSAAVSSPSSSSSSSSP